MALPPPQPSYILRGHGSQIHATNFIRGNSRLITGDAEGWAVIWNLVTKRPTAVWRAHQASILGLNGWGNDRIITHGKDDVLIVWKLNDDDEIAMSTILPVDVSPGPRRQPWILYLLHVNTLNFCSFSQVDLPSEKNIRELLIAVPNTLSSETVDIFHLPSSRKLHTVPSSSLFKGGMVMSLSLFHHPKTNNLALVIAFESGHTSFNEFVGSTWRMLYSAKPHSQPILSLAVSPKKNYYLTSGADAIIAQHTFPCPKPDLTNIEAMKTSEKDWSTKTINTKHAGQQGLKIRNDDMIFATAGWDGRARVYKCNTMRELAVLKWHNEGCYTIAFTDIYPPSEVKKQNPVNDGKNKLAPSYKNTDMNVVKQLCVESNTVIAQSALGAQEERVRKAQSTHWIAVGSKDGKVSLWEIY